MTKTNKELTNIIYDTLMKNNDEMHPNLLLEKVDNQEVNAESGKITFDYLGKKITISISSR